MHETITCIGADFPAAIAREFAAMGIGPEEIWLGTDDVAVSVNATHYCVKSRGVMDGSSSTLTRAFGGRFETEREVRQEFLAAT